MARGTPIITAAGLAREFGSKFDKMRLYACNSFEGLPEDKRSSRRAITATAKRSLRSSPKRPASRKRRSPGSPGFMTKRKPNVVG
ncbi:hypothetical protein [Algicella marina]|uniref:hypothetical protein n=1 Tax=Algicella marina TaxID=2683284 RepID=UPI003D67BA6D